MRVEILNFDNNLTILVKKLIVQKLEFKLRFPQLNLVMKRKMRSSLAMIMKVIIKKLMIFKIANKDI